MLVGRWFSLPYHSMLSAAVQRDGQQASKQHWEATLQHADRQKNLLGDSAKRNMTREKEKGDKCPLITNVKKCAHRCRWVLKVA